MTQATHSDDDIILRARRTGDMAWLIWRHMAVIAPAFGWGAIYERHVMEIGAELLARPSASGDRFWVAERDGVILGCVGLMAETPARARLRLMFVERQARGTGLGRRLAQACVDHARAEGFAEVVLWTVDAMTTARKIYAGLGFEKFSSQPSDLSPDARDEVWRLTL